MKQRINKITCLILPFVMLTIMIPTAEAYNFELFDIINSLVTKYNNFITGRQVLSEEEELPIEEDSDNDGIIDTVDNCPTTQNPTQTDCDNDNMGDACDTNHDSDGDSYDMQGCGGDDCDDNNQNINPRAQEICYDYVDNDCNQQIDCEDGTCKNDPSCSEEVICDLDGDGFFSHRCNGDDCNDNDYLIYPRAYEAPDGIDNDCDGEIDEFTYETTEEPPEELPPVIQEELITYMEEWEKLDAILILKETSLILEEKIYLPLITLIELDPDKDYTLLKMELENTITRLENTIENLENNQQANKGEIMNAVNQVKAIITKTKEELNK